MLSVYQTIVVYVDNLVKQADYVAAIMSSLHVLERLA